MCYLGHIISDKGVRPNPKLINDVKNFPVPKDQRNVREFLGLTGYYRRFLENFSKRAKPLSDLLKKDVKFSWGPEQQTSFEDLRDALCTEPILQYPDFRRRFVLTTDASNIAVGAVLSQGEIGRDLPIAYISRLLNKAEQNYSTTEKECLAFVYAVSHFRPYLFGREFTLVTDHRPLVWLHSVKDPSSRLIRWRIRLAEYQYQVVYKSGKTNLNADALSRNPQKKSVRVLPVQKSGKSEEGQERRARGRPPKVTQPQEQTSQGAEPTEATAQTRRTRSGTGALK